MFGKLSLKQMSAESEVVTASTISNASDWHLSKLSLKGKSESVILVYEE